MVIINHKLKLIRQDPYIFIFSFCVSGRLSPLLIQALFIERIDMIYHQLIRGPVRSLVLREGQYVLKLMDPVCLPFYRPVLSPKLYSASQGDYKNDAGSCNSQSSFHIIPPSARFLYYSTPKGPPQAIYRKIRSRFRERIDV